MSKPTRKRQAPRHLDDYEAEDVASQLADCTDVSSLSDDDSDSRWSEDEQANYSGENTSEESEEEAVAVDDEEDEEEGGRGSGDATPIRPTSRSKKKSPFPDWDPILELDLVDNDNSTRCHFPFNPRDTVGVRTSLLLMDAPGEDSQSVFRNPSESDCFFTLFTDEIFQTLLKQINDYAVHKVRINKPPRKRSRFNDWKKVTDSELLKFIAVTTQMGMDKCGDVRDYWSTDYPLEYCTLAYGHCLSQCIHFIQTHQTTSTPKDGSTKFDI